VTRVVRAMVTQLGMDDELGPEVFGGSGDSGMDGSPYAAWELKEYNEDAARRIDAGVHRLISEAHQKACSLLGANRLALDAISDALLHEESLNLDQIVALVRAIPTGAAS
jgi:cell division protease FtsH